MKRMIMICHIMAFIFCIAIVPTGMYAPYSEVDSSFSFSDKSLPLSKTFRYLYIMDATDEITRTITDEATANISSESREDLPDWKFPFTFFLSLAILPYILLCIWINLNFLLRSKYIDNMYLIKFIHNSDGKKGDQIGILTI